MAVSAVSAVSCSLAARGSRAKVAISRLIRARLPRPCLGTDRGSTTIRSGQSLGRLRPWRAMSRREIATVLDSVLRAWSGPDVRSNGGLCWPYPSGRKARRAAGAASRTNSSWSLISRPRGHSISRYHPSWSPAPTRWLSKSGLVHSHFAASAHDRNWHGAADSECPLFGSLTGVKRTRYAQREFFAFWPLSRRRQSWNPAAQQSPVVAQVCYPLASTRGTLQSDGTSNAQLQHWMAWGALECACAYIGGAFRLPVETRGCGSVFTGSAGSHIGMAS